MTKQEKKEAKELKKKQKYYQSFEYWFEDEDQLKDVHHYGKDYYAYKIFENYLPKLKIPEEGYIVVMGTHRCVSFELLCDMYGHKRCIGFDLFNPTKHKKVIIKDCNLLDDSDDIPIAFCHNDIGNFPKTPELKLHVQKWVAKNTVLGGIVLGRNNFNSRKIDMEALMAEYGFINVNFKDMFSDLDLSILSADEVSSHMFSQRIELPKK